MPRPTISSRTRPTSRRARAPGTDEPWDAQRRAARCRRGRRERAAAARAGAHVSGELHLMGIGGAGMSGIARVLRGHGRTVTGCDRSPVAVDELRGEGIDAYVGHDPAHLRPGVELIISTAVEESEPELAAARRQGLR